MCHELGEIERCVAFECADPANETALGTPLLRTDLSLYDGKPMFPVTPEPSDNSRHVVTMCERFGAAHRIGDWCTIDGLMEEIQSFSHLALQGRALHPLERHRRAVHPASCASLQSGYVGMVGATNSRAAPGT